jgi:RND family efflux transporter MFP subunit
MASDGSTNETGARTAHGLRYGWLILLVVAAAVGGGAWYVWPLLRAADEAQAVTPPPPQVTVSKPVQREITEWDEFTGQFAAVDFVEIRARVSGYLQEIHFSDGQMVKTGDLLFVIDPRPFEIALATAQAQLDQANAQLENANQELQRAAALQRNNNVSLADLNARQRDQRTSAAAVAAGQAAVRSAQLNLEFTRITAPMDGRVGRHEVSIGNLVTGDDVGATSLLTTIVSLDPIHFAFDVSETDFLAYQRAVARGALKSTRDRGIAVAAHLMDKEDWAYQGTLDFVDNRVDPTSGTIRVRGVFENPDNFITPGQFGRIRIPGSDPYMAILVPDKALVTDQSNRLILTVSADGTVVPKRVRPGPTIDGLRVIRSGLDPSDRIIIDGLLRARPGAKVTPVDGTIEPEPASGT